MKKISFCLLAVLLAGCAALGIDKQPDNRSWVSVTCSGFSGWESCKQQALNACPKGYDVANQEENQVTQKRSMQYACK